MGNQTNYSISRRAFLGAATLAGTAAAVSMTGCSTEQLASTGESDYVWDEEYDYVSVGAGSALLGALRAAKNGDKVLVVEKGSQVGGNSAYASGDVWIGNNGLGVAEGDTREKVLDYITAIQDGSLVEQEVIEAYVDGMPTMMEFFSESCGLTPVARPYGDYYLERPGSYFAGRTTAFSEDGGETTLSGGGLIQAMLKACEAAGVTVECDSPVVEIVSRKQETGVPEALGVVVEDSKGKRKSIKAGKAVMLAAGGFEWNEEMKTTFLRGPMPYTCGVSTNTGDMIRLGMELGADLWNMNEVWFVPTFKERAEQNKAMDAPAIMMLFERHCPHGMIVNRFGKRFMNEAMDYDRLYRNFLTWNDWGTQDDTWGYANIPAYFVIDQQYVDSGAPLEVARYGEEGEVEVPEFFVKADTIQELGEKLGIDADALVATVERFNAFCEKGVDEDFGRDTDPFSKGWANVCLPGAESSLGSISQPPFYAAEIAPANLGTCGGLRINEHSQVVHRTGEPIGRLYCCGNNSGLGGPGPLYTGGGGTVSQPMTFSIIAADHMHELESWA